MKAFLKKAIATPKTYWREILAIVTLILCYLFFRSERKEIANIVPSIQASNPYWIAVGVAITVIYILFQSMMYVHSFKTIGSKISLNNAVELFLKRNFLSVFLPAGSVSSLAYTPSQLRKKLLSNTSIHQAGGIYAFVGLLTVFLVGIPVVLFTIGHIKQLQNVWGGLVGLTGILALVIWTYFSIKQKGIVYRFATKYFPSSITFLEEFRSAQFSRKQYLITILYSFGVELTGIIHIYIAMMAIGVQPSLEAAFTAYVISVLLMIVSPFLRGLGAVEFSMIYILHIYGYQNIDAISITVLYRIFEFWLPLVGGIGSFALRGKQLFVRLVPALAIFVLGIVNVLSVVTPPLADRLHFLKKHFPRELIFQSKLLVLFVGVGLIATTAYLIKGYKNAFYTAVVFCVLSLAGNIIKGWDYEEATISLVVMVLLIIGRNEYRIRANMRWIRLGILTSLTLFSIVSLFGVLSFYFISKKHFDIDFSWQQSILHTFKNFFFLYDDTIIPQTRFAKDFIGVCRASGLLCWVFLVFTTLKSRSIQTNKVDNAYQKAIDILKNYGVSANDYFKVYYDKELFFSAINEGFVSYKIASGFAVCLEEPVCDPEDKIEILQEFESYCAKQGLKTIYYRVDENSLRWFYAIGKQKIFIGQEAILDTSTFTTSGRSKQSLRNGLNSLKKKGYHTTIVKAPHNDDFLGTLKTISDEWLDDFEREEYVFSQGMFIIEELRQQDMIITMDENEQIKAFLNIIPNYAKDECSYDLIRKTADAPGGCMDALIITLTEYAKEKDVQFINLGLVPLTGIDNPQSPAEQVIRLASDRLKRFKNYHSLRSFKEKYASVWANKYVVYNKDFDLLQLPGILNKIMKP